MRAGNFRKRRWRSGRILYKRGRAQRASEVSMKKLASCVELFGCKFLRPPCIYEEICSRCGALRMQVLRSAPNWMEWVNNHEIGFRNAQVALIQRVARRLGADNTGRRACLPFGCLCCLFAGVICAILASCMLASFLFFFTCLRRYLPFAFSLFFVLIVSSSLFSFKSVFRVIHVTQSVHISKNIVLPYKKTTATEKMLLGKSAARRIRSLLAKVSYFLWCWVSCFGFYCVLLLFRLFLVLLLGF